MRNCLFFLVAAAVSVSAGGAQAAPVYVGVEGGVFKPRSNVLDIAVDFSPSFPNANLDDATRARYKAGIDADAIAGLDLGRVRVEAELGLKRAAVRDLSMSIGTVILDQDGVPKIPNLAETSVAGRAKVLSMMLNGLVDLDVGRNRIYAGAGIGRARIAFAGGADRAAAFQMIGGVTRRLGEKVEAGIKYRYFRSAKLDLEAASDLPHASVWLTNDRRFRSHSLLLSLTYHFARPAGAAD